MAAVEKEPANIDGVESSSLATPQIAPVRGLLKLLVRADASRSKLSRIGAWLTLLAVFSAIAFLGYLVPTFLAPS